MSEQTTVEENVDVEYLEQFQVAEFEILKNEEDNPNELWSYNLGFDAKHQAVKFINFFKTRKAALTAVKKMAKELKWEAHEWDVVREVEREISNG